MAQPYSKLLTSLYTLHKQFNTLAVKSLQLMALEWYRVKLDITAILGGSADDIAEHKHCSDGQQSKERKQSCGSYSIA